MRWLAILVLAMLGGVAGLVLHRLVGDADTPGAFTARTAFLAGTVGGFITLAARDLLDAGGGLGTGLLLTIAGGAIAGLAVALLSRGASR